MKDCEQEKNPFHLFTYVYQGLQKEMEAIKTNVPLQNL